MNSKDLVVLALSSTDGQFDCERSLRELERRGHVVVRVRGTSQADITRSQVATDFLSEGFEEILWVDSHISFSPDDVDKIRQHDLPITCGLYPRPGQLSIAAKLLPGTPSVSFGLAGGLLEILYGNAGFMHVRRYVFEQIREKLDLPTCNIPTGRPIIPFFMPMVASMEGSQFYLSEDYAFCERVRQAGFKLMADTSIRLWHVGPYRYGWEDAARPPIRHDAFVFPVRPVFQDTPPVDG